MKNWLKVILPAVYAATALIIAFLAFNNARNIVASWELTGLEGVPIKDATATPSASGAVEVVASNPKTPVPLQPVAAPQPIPWDGASRVTVLVMGLDYRSWTEGQGPPLTDTMILLTVDPLSKTEGMLSIPRDLWVNIPGFGYGRINTAYKLGEAAKLPEGGPGLAMDTVEGLLGVPVDYYAIIEFEAFERFIDEIGGVKIDVPEKIVVDPLGDNNTKTLKPGRQVLTGELALAYVRVRKGAGDDFGRADRQQQVILGIRQRILKFDMLPHLVSRSSALYQELSAGIHTNLTLDQVIRLAWLVVQVPDENIRRGIIAPPEMVKLATIYGPEGQMDVLKPITEKIRMLRDELFTATGAIGPATTAMTDTERLQAEAAKIAVLNGTYSAGLASRTSEYLKSQGLNVTVADNAPRLSSYTEITIYTGKPYTLGYLVDLMHVQPLHIHHIYKPDSPVEVQIILGDDWANNNPMSAP